MVKFLVEVKGVDVTSDGEMLLYKAAYVWNMILFVCLSMKLTLVAVCGISFSNRVVTWKWSNFFCRKERLPIISTQFFLLRVAYVIFFFFMFVFSLLHFVLFFKTKLKTMIGWQCRNCQAHCWDGRQPFLFGQQSLLFSFLPGISSMNFNLLECYTFERIKCFALQHGHLKVIEFLVKYNVTEIDQALFVATQVSAFLNFIVL